MGTALAVLFTGIFLKMWPFWIVIFIIYIIGNAIERMIRRPFEKAKAKRIQEAWDRYDEALEKKRQLAIRRTNCVVKNGVITFIDGHMHYYCKKCESRGFNCLIDYRDTCLPTPPIKYI